MLNKLFSSKIENSCKVITIMGITFRFKNWPIRSFRYSTDLKLPVFVPINIRNDLICLNFMAKFLKYDDYDWDGEFFSNDYRNLVSGLDEKSIETVRRSINIYKFYSVLQRKKRVKPDDVRYLGHLLRPSQEEIAVINKEFYSQIYWLENGTYRYKKYILPLNHFESSVFYYRHCIDEFKNQDRFKYKDIIDVGGYIGDSAVVFSDYTERNVHTFEASRKNFELLKITLELNQCKNVIPVMYALGDNSSKTLYLVESGSCTQTAVNNNSIAYDNNSVECITLDDYVEENNLEVGLIKVDIEGFEQTFLKGAEKTIKNQKPSLLISIYHSPDDYLHIKPIIESWNLGYKFRIICPKENRLLETLLVAEVQ